MKWFSFWAFGFVLGPLSSQGVPKYFRGRGISLTWTRSTHAGSDLFLLMLLLLLEGEDQKQGRLQGLGWGELTKYGG